MNISNSQIVSIFADALECKTDEHREAFLDNACGDNAEARARIEALLRAHLEAGEFLQQHDERPPVDQTTDAPQRAMVGTLIGPYKLLEEIGEGGMGVVYMADQQAPVRRRVALKIIKPGMDSRQVIARFEAERQALAMMDHPNIARVLDAGTTPSGGPYFVMELVRGIPITDYCDQNNLTVAERLELFVAVCQAVQHAHQKGVVHRDLKPTNVLVTLHDGRPVPKVIDFGVAKAINQQLTDKTLFTNFAQMVGTPLYMSPEQAEMSGLDVDTRSDVYSLGVLLYELLTGTTPFDQARLREAAFDEIRRIIREEEPPRPSTRISTLGETRTSMAAHRKADPDRLSKMLRGELDWVVMRALEKDRTRRYETANGLARDVQRFLEDQPVEACPPSAAYRFRKFSRRNRVALGTAALVAASLVLGIVGSTWQAIRATRAEGLAQERLIAETRARTEADVARTAEAQQRLLAESERAKAEQQRAVAEANFQMAREAVDKYFTAVSENDLLDEAGMEPLRKELLEAALEYYRNFAAQQADDPAVLGELAATHSRIAQIYAATGSAEWPAAYARCLDIVERLHREGVDPALWAGSLEGSFSYGSTTGDPRIDEPREALRVFQRGTDIYSKLAEAHPEVVAFQEELAMNCLVVALLQGMGGIRQLEQAITNYRRSLQIWTQLARQNPAQHLYANHVCITLQNLPFLLRVQGRRDEAARVEREGIATLRETYGNVNVEVAKILGQSAGQLANAGQFDEAEKRLREAQSICETLIEQQKTPRSLRSVRDVHASVHKALGELLAQTGRQADADKQFHEASRISKELARQTSAAIHQLTVVDDLLAQGKLTEALKEARSAARLHPTDWRVHDRLLNVLNRINDPEKTLAVMRENAELSPNSEPAHHWYGLVLKDQGRLEEAAREFARGIEIIPDTPWSYHYIAEIRLRQNRLAEALDAAQSAIRISPAQHQFHTRLREVLDKIGNDEKTVEVMRETTQSAPDSEPAHHQYGLALMAQGRLDEAAQEFARGIEINPDTPLSYYHIAGIRLRQDRLSEALEAARAAVRINPVEYRFHMRLLEVLSKIADSGDEEARAEVASLSQTVRQLLTTVEEPDSLNNFAWWLVVPREVNPQIAELAVQAALRGCELRLHDTMLLNTLGVAQYRAGDYEAAIESLERSRCSDTRIDWPVPAIDGYFLAMAQAQLGHTEQAEKWFRAAELAMALFAPGDDELAKFREEAIDILGKKAEPLADAAPSPETEGELFQLCLAADPDAAWPHSWMGTRLAERGAWAEAEEQLTLAARCEEPGKEPGSADETDSKWVYERAVLLLQTGQLDAYRRLCLASSKRFIQSDDAWAGIHCKLAPHALDDYTPALNWIEELVRKKPGHRLNRGLQAHLLYRSGDAEAAASQLERLVSSGDPASADSPFNMLFLAMAHHDLGHDAKAERYFRDATDWIDKNGQAELGQGAVLPQPLRWPLRLDLELLHAEAAQLLGMAQVATEAPPDDKP